MRTVGVLALQGDFLEHAQAIQSIGIKSKLIKSADDLNGVDGLIIPGGESTVMGLLAKKYNLIEPIQKLVKSGLPVLGTCAGLIMLAGKVHSQKQGGQTTIGGLNVVVNRNFNGSQVNSFEAKISAKALSGKPIGVMFIRPPAILRVGSGVEVLASYDFGKGDEPVLIRQGNIVASSFHTELDNNSALHQYFIQFNTSI